MTLQMKFEHYRADLLERPAERLVVTGIRCWMAGYEYGDIDCWEAAWREYSNALGTSDARSLIVELQNLVRTLRDVSNRTISCYPHCCRHVCRDECMAISLISAHQYQNSKAVRVAAHYLTNLDRCPALDQLIDASGSYASALSQAEQFLLPVPVNVIADIAEKCTPPNENNSTKH